MINFANSWEDPDSQNAHDIFYHGAQKYFSPVVRFGNGGGGGSGDAGITGVPGNDPLGYGGNFSATGGDADPGFADAAFSSADLASEFAGANSPTTAGLSTPGSHGQVVPSFSSGQHGQPVGSVLSGDVSNATVAKGVALAMSAIPLVGLALTGLTLAGALNGNASGNVGAAMAAGAGAGGLGGPGGDQFARYGSNPILEKPTLTTSTTGQEGGTTTGQPTKKRGRNSTLLTGPLGVLGSPNVETKTLMQRNMRSTLG